MLNTKAWARKDIEEMETLTIELQVIETTELGRECSKFWIGNCSL